MPKNNRVVPFDVPGSGYDYSLPDTLKVSDISKILGHKANLYDDDPGKVKYNWKFKLDGVGCAIWDYKGSRWSVYDPTGGEVKKLFGL